MGVIEKKFIKTPLEKPCLKVMEYTGKIIKYLKEQIRLSKIKKYIK